MIKLKTGVSTSLDFVKALKERGQDASPAFPAETLREQLDALSDDVKVTFKSNNETIMQVVNDYEPGPTPVEKVTLTLDFNGGKTSDTSAGVGSISIELDKGSSYTPTDPAADPDFLIPKYSEYNGWSLVKDDESTKIVGSITVESNMTIYTLWEYVGPAFTDLDGVNPDAVQTIYFKDSLTIDPTDPDLVAFKDSLHNYGPSYDGEMFDVDSFGGVTGTADLDSAGLKLAFVDSATESIVFSSWRETSPGVFTRTGGTEEQHSSPEAGGIIFVGQDDGSILNAPKIFLSLVQIAE